MQKQRITAQVKADLREELKRLNAPSISDRYVTHYAIWKALAREPHGFTVPQVAEALGVPYGVVHRLLTRGWAVFTQRIGHETRDGNGIKKVIWTLETSGIPLPPHLKRGPGAPKLPRSWEPNAPEAHRRANPNRKGGLKFSPRQRAALGPRSLKT